MQTKKQIADRGKWAESEVEKCLKRMNELHYSFAYDRQPDARAAGGRLKAALCDFLWWWQFVGGDGRENRVSGLLEVKETKHDFRLNKDKLDQLPRMKKVKNAGGLGVVMVHHSTLGKWRIIPLTFFIGTEVPPSWDLSSFRLYDTPQEALNWMTEGFPHIPLKD